MFFAAVGLIVLGASAATGREPEEDWKAKLSREQYVGEDGTTLKYRLYKPAAKAGAKYPLVLFLHGAGERGDDNEAQLQHGVRDFLERQTEAPCFLIVPQCPREEFWVEIDWGGPGERGTIGAQPSPPMQLVLEVVERIAAKAPVDRDRMYVTGLSMGGYGTWFLAGREDSPFVAAAPVCGGGDPALAKRYVDLPLWVFHGGADEVVPAERSREMVEAIKAAGGMPRYTEYPGVGHDSWTRTYADGAFHEWLFSQRGSGN